MSSQITIDDLRNVVKSYGANKPKKNEYSIWQLAAIFAGFNRLFFGSRTDYLDSLNDLRKSLKDRGTSLLGRKKQLGINELSYYDPSHRFLL